MNWHKLFNGLVIFSLLLPAVLTGNPTPTRAAPEAAHIPIGPNRSLITGTAGVELSPGYNRTANPGSIVTYTHTLTNTGTSTDTFTLDVSSSHGWPVAVLGVTGSLSLPLELEAGLTATLLVSLTVPTVAISGTVDMAIITATSQTSPTVLAIATDSATVQNVNWYVYLPLVLRRWPPIPDTPVLNPISNPDGVGNYIVSWNAAYQAITNTLQEDDNEAFSSPTTQYYDTGIFWQASGKPAGTTYYRVKATNSWGNSGWSNIQATTVFPGIHGRVTYQGSPASGAPIILRFYNGSSYSVIRTTTTQADGLYQFTDAPPLTPGQKYYVRYWNKTNPSYVAHCGGPALTLYTAGTSVAGGTFDIANIPQMSPPSGATIALPYTFQWTRRNGVPSDNYILEIWNGSPRWETAPLGYVSQYTLNNLPPGLNHGTLYWWDVAVRGTGGTYCYSYDQNRTVTFSSGVTGPQDTGEGLRRLHDGNSDIVDVPMTRILRK